VTSVRPVRTHAREGGEQFAVLVLHCVLGQHGGVFDFVRGLGELRDLLAAVIQSVCEPACCARRRRRSEWLGGHGLSLILLVTKNTLSRVSTASLPLGSTAAWCGARRRTGRGLCA
jgi:hypothetical protein